MSKMMICPKCMSTDTKRLIFEWSIKESVILIVLGLYEAFYWAYLRYWIPGDKWDVFDSYEFNFFLLIIIIAFVIFPILLNLRFPRYKCKSCGKKFKPNGEDAEDVFADYE